MARAYPIELVEFFINHRHRLRERSYIFDMFSVVLDRPQITLVKAINTETNRFIVEGIPSNKEKLRLGDICQVAELEDAKNVLYLVDDITEVDGNDQCVAFQVKLEDEFTSLIGHKDIIPIPITSKHIENLKEGESITTTFGNFFLNQVVFVQAVGDRIPFRNHRWKCEPIETIFKECLLNKVITKQEFDTLANNHFFYGHGFCEIFVPGYSRKSITTHPDLKKRRAELLEQYKDQLDDPIIAAKIENELIKLDKEWLKDDVSMDYLESRGKKVFDIQRRKLFCIGGLIEGFDASGVSYEFLTRSLSDGWDLKSFAALANENRKGIYGRGKSTAKGGETTKFILRIFTGNRINMEDCGSKRGLVITLGPDNIKSHYGSSIIVGDSLVILSADTHDQFLNKTVTIRSPQYCKNPNGLCYRCVEYIFKQLTYEAIGVLALQIGSTFLSDSMASIHGKKLDATEFTDPLKWVS